MNAATMTRALKVPGLTSTQVRILALLANYANDAGLAWPSRDTLAQDADLTVDGVKKAIRALVRHGYITRHSGGHNGRTTRYRLHPDRWPPPNRGDAGPSYGDVGGTPVPPLDRVGVTGVPGRGDGCPQKGVQRSPLNYSGTTRNPSPLPPADGRVLDDLVAQGHGKGEAERLIRYAQKDPDTHYSSRLTKSPPYLRQALAAVQANERRQEAQASNVEAARELAALEADPLTSHFVARVRTQLPDASPARLLFNVKLDLQEEATA